MASDVPRPDQLPPAHPPLILSREPVGRLFPGPVQRRPHTAVVYATADGAVSDQNEVLTPMRGLFGPYRIRYEVYTGVQDFTTTTADDPLPTAEDRFSFSAKVEIEWHVVDARTVVRQGIVDGRSVARRHIIERLRKISRRHVITECHLVEEEINALARPAGIPIEHAGILIDRVVAQVTLDDAAGEYLRRKTEIQRGSEIDRLEQPRTRTAQAHERDLELDRIEAVSKALAGDFGLIAIHLERNPDESMRLIEMIRNRQQELEKRHDDRYKELTTVFQKMMDDGFIQNADATEIRTAILNQTIGTVGAGDGVHQYDSDIGLLLRKNLIPPNGGSADGGSADGDREPPIPVPTPPNGANVNGWHRRRKPPTAGGPT